MNRSMTLEMAYLPSANKAVWNACPDRLAVVARLFGLEAAPPERNPYTLTSKSCSKR